MADKKDQFESRRRKGSVPLIPETEREFCLPIPWAETDGEELYATRPLPAGMLYVIEAHLFGDARSKRLRISRAKKKNDFIADLRPVILSLYPEIEETWEEISWSSDSIPITIYQRWSGGQCPGFQDEFIFKESWDMNGTTEEKKAVNNPVDNSVYISEQFLFPFSSR